jgi:hypothetical protein
MWSKTTLISAYGLIVVNGVFFDLKKAVLIQSIHKRSKVVAVVIGNGSVPSVIP